MIVAKRYQGEKHFLTEFVQPNTASVITLLGRIQKMPGDFAANCLNWVRSNIEYPNGNAECVDWHYYEAFRIKGPNGQREVLRTKWATDFWQFPAETMSLKMGDCEDGSILLCSLLRHEYSEQDVFVTIGRFENMGHAWVTLQGQVFETSPCGGGGIYEEKYPYVAYYRFNDQVVY